MVAPLDEKSTTFLAVAPQLRVSFANQLEHFAGLLAAHKQGLGTIKVGDLVPLGFHSFG